MLSQQGDISLETIKYNDMNYLDRNEFNFEPSQKVIEAIRNFNPKDLCFYTRIYDEGKKSVISVRVSEICCWPMVVRTS